MKNAVVPILFLVLLIPGVIGVNYSVNHMEYNRNYYENKEFENNILALNEDLSSDVKSVHSVDELSNLLNWNLNSKKLQNRMSIKVQDLGESYGIEYSGYGTKIFKYQIKKTGEVISSSEENSKND